MDIWIKNKILDRQRQMNTPHTLLRVRQKPPGDIIQRISESTNLGGIYRQFSFFAAQFRGSTSGTP